MMLPQNVALQRVLRVTAMTTDVPFYHVNVSIKALLQAIDVLKRKVRRQHEENEALEAKVREQVVSEVMEVINDMQNGFRYVF